MSKPWAGRTGWIWYESQAGGVENAITLAKQFGMAGLFVKEADEGRLWQQTSDEELAQYRDAGLAISAWTYAYGSNPRAAAQAIIELAGRFDGVIIDAEAELRNAEGMDRSRTEVIDEMLAPVRAAIGWDYPLAVAPLPIARFHTDLNYARWGFWQCDYIPQMYANVLGPSWPIARLFQEWDEPLDKTYPALGAYGDTGYSGDSGARYPEPDEIRAAEALAVGNGCPGVSYWRIDTIRAATWPFAPGEPYAGTMQENDVSEDQITAIREQLVTLIGLAGGQEAAGDTGAGQVIRTCVDRIIEAYPPLGRDG